MERQRKANKGIDRSEWAIGVTIIVWQLLMRYSVDQQMWSQIIIYVKNNLAFRDESP